MTRHQMPSTYQMLHDMLCTLCNQPLHWHDESLCAMVQALGDRPVHSVGRPLGPLSTLFYW